MTKVVSFILMCLDLLQSADRNLCYYTSLAKVANISNKTSKEVRKFGKM